MRRLRDAFNPLDTRRVVDRLVVGPTLWCPVLVGRGGLRSGTARSLALSAVSRHGIATLPFVESRTVFADLSGRRRRLIRRLGIASACALTICLGAVAVALAGGPQ